jgi:hypothetical protein
MKTVTPLRGEEVLYAQFDAFLKEPGFRQSLKNINNASPLFTWPSGKPPA